MIVVSRWVANAFGLVIGISLACSGCASRTLNQGVESDLSWSPNSELLTSGDCSHEGQCARVEHVFPVFQGNGQSSTLLNRWVLERLSGYRSGYATAESRKAAARAFLGDFEAATAQLPDEVGPDWFDAHRIEVIHDTDRLVSLAHDRSWYTGGAHPNASRLLVTFDLEDAEELTLDTVLRDGVETRLADLQTRALRRVHGLPADADLADAGFSTDADGRVPLSRNFAVVADGWLFRWDAYEIAPYAMGPSEVTLGWREVANLVRRGSPAAPPEPPKVAEEDENTPDER